MNQSAMSGYLEIIMGPMFSGKTSKLLEIYKQCNFCNIPVCVINHQSDTRYSDTQLSSHDGVMIPCIQTSSIAELLIHNHTKDVLIFSNAEVVLVNEAQFFGDLYDGVVEMLRRNKRVYICGLDGDFKKMKFGQILDLIPHCDTVTKLHSLCGLCKNGEAGIFSKRISNDDGQTLVGADMYIPVCRKCYDKDGLVS